MICRQILGCGHPSRSSTTGITSWSMVTGCLLPKSELIFICCWYLSLHRMGLLPDLTMDNAAGLRLSTDPSEAYDQISDCCHKLLLRKMLWTSWDERTDRGKTVYPPPFQWSGGIIKLLWHMIMHGSVIRTKFQVCKLQLKHMILTWQTLEWSWG